MFINERANAIIEYLRIHKKATISELAEHLYASESTVRRDLAEMQSSGLIARYHGGAILLDGSGEVSIFARAERDATAKEACALNAIEKLDGLIKYNTIFIDNSSTCLALAKKLDFAKKTVITNGLHIALALAQKPHIELILLGGIVNSSTSAITGALSIRTLENLSIDLALTSCAALNLHGSYELSLETAQLKQVALSNSKHKVLIAADNKLDTDAMYRVALITDYDFVITNASDEAVKPYKASGANIYN